MKIGAKIIELRKAKGMTQEQLAAAVGVSAPAVSKWETDSSYPDITLLCPLARALGTDVDTLLAFEENLPEEDLGRYMVEIAELASAKKMPKAEGRLLELLYAYPSSIPLKFSATAVLSFFEMNAPDAAEEDKARWSKLKKELVRAVYDDGNPAYHLHAVSMLVALALGENDLDRAEELLKETTINTGDFTALWVRLYTQKGQRDKALEVLQRQLYKLVCDMRTCLMSMLGEELALDGDRCIEACRVLRQLDDTFCVAKGLSEGLFAEVYMRMGKTEEALDCLERLAEQAAKQMEPPSPLLFAPAVAPGPQQLERSRKMYLDILQELEKEECFRDLRQNERFRKVFAYTPQT